MGPEEPGSLETHCRDLAELETAPQRAAAVLGDAATDQQRQSTPPPCCNTGRASAMRSTGILGSIEILAFPECPLGLLRQWPREVGQHGAL